MEKVAFVFPGQGSQKLGMLADYYDQFPIIKSTFDEANQALGFDLWGIVQNNAEKLAQTQYTQPALLASSVAIYRLLMAQGFEKPALMAGHSLGEYSALVCAGALDFGDALRLVKARGEFMQEAVPVGTGAMCAIIALTDEQVRDICEKSSEGEVVTAANYNAPGQVVISGEAGAVARASILAKESGARMAQMLPVSVPSHCELMRPAAQKLAKLLEEINISIPTVPVIHNADVVPYSHKDDIKDALVRQLYAPVRWAETIILMADDGIESILECGSGKVLSGLGKRIVKGMKLQNTSSVSELEKILELTK
jgi:[acyl-carrier-protein] S-malonyltransferase